MILLASSAMFPSSHDHETRFHSQQLSRSGSTSPMAIRDLLNPQHDDVVATKLPPSSALPLRIHASRKRPLEVRLHMSRLFLSRMTPQLHIQPTQDTVVAEAVDLSPSHPHLAPHQCRYRNGKCNQQRAVKTNGQLHTLCDMHRHRNIVNQHRVDARRRKERLAKSGP